MDGLIMVCFFSRIAFLNLNSNHSLRTASQLAASLILIMSLGACGGSSGGSDSSLDTNETAVAEGNPVPVAGECIELPRFIESDIQLSDACYTATADLVVTNGASLTINAGVTVLFAANTSLTVSAGGTLNVQGGANNPAVLAGAESLAGYWNGVSIQSGAEGLIEYAVIRDAGVSGHRGGSVTIGASGRLRMTHSLITNGSGPGLGSSYQGAQLLEFAHNTITANQDVPLSIPANQVQNLGADNILVGNGVNPEEGRDYVAVMEFSALNSEQTWPDVGVPYLLETTVTVSANWTLEPGVTLMFASGTGLVVNHLGQLNASGTEAAPITFRGTEASPGFWRGIEFNASAADNRLQHVVIENGGQALTTNEDAAVRNTGGQTRLVLKHASITGSAGFGFSFSSPIVLEMSDVTVSNNEITGLVRFDDADQLDASSRFNGNSVDRILLHADLNRETVLPRLDVPYEMSASAAVNRVFSQLEIEAGTSLYFPERHVLLIEPDGRLLARGEESNPINFSGIEPVPGAWGGIVFNGSNGDVLDHTNIEYAGDTTYIADGPVTVRNVSNLTIVDTLIKDSASHGLVVEPDTVGIFENISFERIAGENVSYQSY